VIKGVEQALVRPRVCRRVETYFTRRVGMYFTEEGQTTIEVSIPGY
jgi:hypothetical protein